MKLGTWYSNNGNNTDVIEEYVYVFTRPLNNTELARTVISIENFRDLGLDRSQAFLPFVGGRDAGIPTHIQTIYAEKRMYSYNENLMALRLFFLFL